MKLIVTVGLPGSGKTTWAERYVLEHEAGSVVRVNRDSLREMLNADRFKGRKTETFVEQIRDAIIIEALTDGKTVICDDTNLNPSVSKHLADLAQRCAAQLVLQDFTSVPLDECIKRDLKRSRTVGERVIRQMHSKYIAQPASTYSPDPSLPAAIVVDVDGTIALNNGHRGHYDYDKIMNDAPNQPVIDLVKSLSSTDPYASVVIVSGRDDDCMDLTLEWIERQEIAVREIFMRRTGDKRQDALVKREIFDAHIRDRYRVLYVIDDRNQVVDMWRSLGLTVLQVADGDF